MKINREVFEEAHEAFGASYDNFMDQEKFPIDDVNKFFIRGHILWIGNPEESSFSIYIDNSDTKGMSEIVLSRKSPVFIGDKKGLLTYRRAYKLNLLDQAYNCVVYEKFTGLFNDFFEQMISGKDGYVGEAIEAACQRCLASEDFGIFQDSHGKFFSIFIEINLHDLTNEYLRVFCNPFSLLGPVLDLSEENQDKEYLERFARGL